MGWCVRWPAAFWPAQSGDRSHCGRVPAPLLVWVEAVDPALLEQSVSGQGESGPGVQVAWSHISNAFRQSLDEVTLESLANQQGGPMFYI